MFNLKQKQKKEDTEYESVSTAKIAVWYVIGNFFAKGVAMLSTPIFTRIMSKNDFGEFSNFTSWENIIVIFVTLDLSSSIARAKYDFGERMDEYLSSILIFSNLVTLCVYFCMELHAEYFMKLLSMDIRYIRMLFVYLLFMPAFSYLQIKHRIYRKYKFFVVCAVSSAVIRTVLSVIFVLCMENKFMGRLCGYLVPVTLFNFVLWVVVLMEGKKISWDCVRYGCRISVPLVPHALSGIVLGNSDRIMITHYCGSEVTALYSLAYTVSTMTSLLWTSMNQAWSPWLYDHMNLMDKKAIRKSSKIYLGIFMGLLLGVFLTAPEMMLVLGGEQYYGARYVMPPVILACAFQFIYGMYVNLEIYAKKTFTISLGTMGAAVLNVFLNKLYIPQFGYIAAAYTTTVGYCALLLFHYGIVETAMKEYADLYDTRFIFFMIMFMIFFCGVSLILYEHDFFRYLLIFLYVLMFAAAVFKYRKDIRRLLVS